MWSESQGSVVASWLCFPRCRLLNRRGLAGTQGELTLPSSLFPTVAGGSAVGCKQAACVTLGKASTRAPTEQSSAMVTASFVYPCPVRLAIEFAFIRVSL